MIKCCYRKENKVVEYDYWHQDYSCLYLLFFYKFKGRFFINVSSISRWIWRIIVILPLTLFLLPRLLQLWVIEKSCSPANLSRVYWMKVLKKKKKNKQKKKNKKQETKLLIIIITTTTTTTIILSYWNTVELPPGNEQTLHFNLPKATTVPTETPLAHRRFNWLYKIYQKGV